MQQAFLQTASWKGCSARQGKILPSTFGAPPCGSSLFPSRILLTHHYSPASQPKRSLGIKEMAPTCCTLNWVSTLLLSRHGYEICQSSKSAEGCLDVMTYGATRILAKPFYLCTSQEVLKRFFNRTVRHNLVCSVAIPTQGER